MIIHPSKTHSSHEQISAKEVDFQSMSLEELELRENMKIYPPRFVIKVSGSAAAENSRAIFTFQGAIETIVKEVILSKGKVLLTPYHINMNRVYSLSGHQYAYVTLRALAM